MKKIIMICILLPALSKSHSQFRDSTINKSNYKTELDLLIKKSKNQKTWAWIIVSAGSVMAISGASIISKDANDDISDALTTVFSFGFYTPPERKHNPAGPILAYTGTAAIIGSIPLFVSASKNKARARLFLKNEPVRSRLNKINNFPAAGIAVNF